MEIVLVIVIGLPVVIFSYRITKHDIDDLYIRDGRIAPYEFQTRDEYRAAASAYRLARKGRKEG